MADMFSLHHDVHFTPDLVTDYFFTVLIGNGQSGSTTFKSPDPDGTFFSPDVISAPLHNGAALLGTQLPVVSVVMDINPFDDDMIVSYYITEKNYRSIAEMLAAGEEPEDVVKMTAGAGQTITFFTRLIFS